MPSLPFRALACIILTCGLLASTTTTALPAVETDPSISLRSSPSTPQVGATVRMRGAITPVSSGRTIQLQMENTPGSWRTVRQVTTDSLGQYVGSLTFGKSGVRRLRAKLVSSPGLGAATSPLSTLTVLAKPGKGNTFTAPLPVVSGRYQVGEKLTATAGTWKPKPTNLTYRWLRDGVGISAATSDSYVLTPSDLGTIITVEVRAARNSQPTARENINDTEVAKGTIVPGHVTIAGDPSVGSPLSADASGWSPTPTTVPVQWRHGRYYSDNSDAGAKVAVTVVAERPGYAATATSSAPVTVAAAPPTIEPTPEPTEEPPPTEPTPEPSTEPTPTDPTPTPDPTETSPIETRRTLGDYMRPASSAVLPASTATVTFSATAPDWYAHNTFVRWDTPGAFSHSLDPVPYGTLFSAGQGADYTRRATGAEYHVNSSTWKNADVSFRVTGKRFAVRYWTSKDSDAMLWIDGVPSAAEPYAGSDPQGTGRWNWLVVNRVSSEPATVRFAGPLVFSGVDFASTDAVEITAAAEFTLGVISDSTFESLSTIDPQTQAPGSMLSTLTGFRVWNMAEGGTGYVNDGTGVERSGGRGYPGHLTSPFGSDRRIASITAAPIDALLVNGSINDLKWSADIARDAMDQFLDRVAAARPDLPVVLVSLEPVSYEGIRDQTDPRFQALNAVFAGVAARHSNVVGLIDPFTADWLTGTGNASHPTGDGNQDIYVGPDGVHLNAVGQAYYQGRIADSLRPILAKLP